MTGETNLAKLIKDMSPQLNEGEYVFVTVDDISQIDRNISLFFVNEKDAEQAVNVLRNLTKNREKLT